MPELESKQALPRSEIATYLREFADELDTSNVAGDAMERGTTAPETRTDSAGSTERTSVDVTEPTDREADATPETAETDETKSTGPDDRVTLVVGDNSATINPPETPNFEIEVESDSSLVGASEQQSVSFELEWTVEEVDDESNIEIK